LKIIAEIEKDLKKVKEALKYEVASGHKIVLSSEEEKTDLLQAELLLLSAKFGNYDFEKLLPAALAVELFSLAFKRHYHSRLPTPDSRLINFSLIIGDFYYAKALSLVSSLNDVRVVEILAQTILSFTRGNSEDLEEPERLSELAALYKTSCWLGALIGVTNGKIIEALKAFGVNLGLLYEAKGSSIDIIETCKDAAKKALDGLPNGPDREQLKLIAFEN